LRPIANAAGCHSRTNLGLTMVPVAATQHTTRQVAAAVVAGSSKPSECAAIDVVQLIAAHVKARGVQLCSDMNSDSLLNVPPQMW